MMDRKKIARLCSGKREPDPVIAGVSVFHLTDDSLENYDIAVIDGIALDPEFEVYGSRSMWIFSV